MEAKNFDLIVIGGGPGGYPAAIRAAQNGKRVALIEAKELGGTCLNRGCIPSKSLIASAETLLSVQKASEFGITTGKVSFDYEKMAQRKDRVVGGIRKGLEGLIASNQITLFRGFGKFISPKEVKVTGQDNVLLQADKIIIATGSEPRNFSSFPFDYERIHDSTSLLALEKLPKSILIVGGGIIGSEFASLYSLLGVQVTLFELMPRLIPMEEETVATVLMSAFEKRGIQMHFNAQVSAIKRTEKGVSLHANEKEFTADIALVAIGRSLNTSGIGLEQAGVLVNDNGLISVDDKMETNVPGIYAVGDIASKWWLAHVASHQGEIAASNATGHTARMKYNAIPSGIFTHPEIGTVGLSLKSALEQGYQAAIGAFPFQALGKSHAIGSPEGFAQIVFDRRTNQILGAQVVGHEAATLVAEMAVAIANELTLECLAETIHAHPTLPEAWMEAAFVGLGAPLHLPPKKVI